MTDKPPKSDVFDSDLLVEDCARLLHSLIASLQDGLHGEGEHSAVVADICRATTSAAAVAAEIRARQKLAAAQRDALKPAMVLEWFRVQPRDVQLHLQRELDAIAGGSGSLL